MAVPPKSPSAGGARVASRPLDLPAAASLAALLLVLLLGAVAVRNAFVYPPVGGYDAAEHIAYARSLIEQGELPYKSGAYYTPPLWYVLAGGGIELGDVLGMEEPERMAQLLNALLTTGTGLLVLVLARSLFPRRPLVALGAVAFFVACPITLRMATMFHPQALVLFLSTAGLLVIVRMLARRSYGLASAALAGTLLGAAELVRSVALWSIGVGAIAMLAAVVVDRHRRRRAAVAMAIVVALGVAVPLPWYVYLQQTYGYAVFGRPPTTQPAPAETAPQPASSAAPVAASPSAPAPLPRRPGSFFVRVGLPEVLTKPHRGELDRSFWPTLYADTWGDAFGAWSWGPTRAAMSVGVEDRLSLQSFAGVPLTFVAGTGWLAFVALVLRRFRTRLELLVVVGVPAAALAGLVYYGIRSYEPDLDFVKGMFALTAVPFWALSFGFAADGLTHRLPRVAGVALGVLLAACLAVCLEFGIA
jgi:4-amino-4-deoxy-L-arabinose transferase-like glycosyltransferase